MNSKIMLLALLMLSSGAHAYSCDSSGGTLGWAGGDANVPITVDHNLNPGKNIIIDLSKQVVCKNDSTNVNWIDYMSLAANGLEMSPQFFSGLNTGVTIMTTGRDYLSPVPEIQNILTLNAQNSAWIPVQIYFELSSLSRGIHINQGDYLGRVKFTQSNNQQLG